MAAAEPTNTAAPEAVEGIIGILGRAGPAAAEDGAAAGKAPDIGGGSGGGGGGGGGQGPIGEAQQGLGLISSITDFIHQQEQIAVKAAQDKSNDFNIKQAFMDNTLGGIEQIVGGKYNSLIVANTQSDNVNLNGILSPNTYDPATVAISNSMTVSYRVWVFVDGTYTKNAGFGGSEWAWCGNVARADKKVKHGVHTDPVSTLTFTKR